MMAMALTDAKHHERSLQLSRMSAMGGKRTYSSGLRRKANFAAGYVEVSWSTVIRLDASSLGCLPMLVPHQGQNWTKQSKRDRARKLVELQCRFKAERNARLNEQERPNAIRKYIRS